MILRSRLRLGEGGGIFYPIDNASHTLWDPFYFISEGKLYKPPVLVPSLDLGVGETKFGGELHPVLNRQILLPLKVCLEGLELGVGEGCPRLPLFLGVACGVGVLVEAILV